MNHLPVILLYLLFIYITVCDGYRLWQRGGSFSMMKATNSKLALKGEESADTTGSKTDGKESRRKRTKASIKKAASKLAQAKSGEDRSQSNNIPEPSLTQSNFISSLPPLTGSLEDRRLKMQEKNSLTNIAKEYLAPTPVGQEPKLVQAAKTITWIAVLALVLVELVVSIKVGGSPFDMKRAVLDPAITTTSTPTAPPK